MKQDTLICKCKKIQVRSTSASLLNECKCASPRRKEREFKQVIVQVEDE